MADKKITELTELMVAADLAVLPIVDIATGETKKIKYQNLKDHAPNSHGNEVHSSSFIIGSQVPANINIKQTEIDFGATPIAEKEFTVDDVDVLANSNLLAQVSYEAPTYKDLDELEMDDLQIRCQPAVGYFLMFIRAADGSYLADRFKINYLIG